MRFVAPILLVGLLAGCFWTSPEVLTPTTIGVVTGVERLSDRIVAYHLT